MPKRQNLKDPGKCIFCGRTGMSKEHVLSNWVKRLLRPTATSSHLSSSLGTGVGTTLPLTQMPQIRQGNLLSRQVRVVCRVHCNNDWMDKLERRTKPHLTPLIFGNRHVITATAQQTLATWFTKTTMTAEYFYQGEVVIPQTQRTYLMEKGRPPEGWQIWVAPMRSMKHFCSVHHFAIHNIEMRLKGHLEHTEALSPQITIIGLNGSGVCTCVR